MPEAASLWRTITTMAVGCVALAGVPQPAAAQPAGSKSFVDDFASLDRERWYVSDGWANGAHQNCTWSSGLVSAGDGRLVLGFERKPNGERDFSCAEIQTKEQFHYGVYEARFRTDTGSGLNAAFFTYIGPQNDQPHDEIDFEALTRDTSRIEVNTYVDGKPHNGGKVDVEGGTDGGFNDYAIVWEPERIRWYVNGALVHEATEAPLPSRPQKIFFSFWGTDTLNEWMGAFDDPGRRLSFEVERVSFTEFGEECQFPESVACDLE